MNSQCSSPFPAHFFSVISIVFPKSSVRKPSRKPLNRWQHGLVVLRAMVSKESVIMIFPVPFVVLMFLKDSFPQFSLSFSLERAPNVFSLVLAFFMIFLQEFAPFFLAAVHRITEAADGEKISSRAVSMSLKVLKLKSTPWLRLFLLVRVVVVSVVSVVIVDTWV